MFGVVGVSSPKIGPAGLPGISDDFVELLMGVASMVAETLSLEGVANAVVVGLVSVDGDRELRDWPEPPRIGVIRAPVVSLLWPWVGMTTDAEPEWMAPSSVSNDAPENGIDTAEYFGMFEPVLFDASEDWDTSAVDELPNTPASELPEITTLIPLPLGRVSEPID